MRPGSRYDDINAGGNSPDTTGISLPSARVGGSHTLANIESGALPRASSPVPPPQLSSTSPVVALRHQSRSGISSSGINLTGASRVGGASRAVDATCITDVQYAGLNLRESIHAAQTQQGGRLGGEGSCVSAEELSTDQPTIPTINTFLYPAVPSGVKTLVFDLKSNWGDEYYVGLCGIEVYDGEGRRVVPGTAAAAISRHSREGYSIHTSFDLASEATGNTKPTGDETIPLPNFLRESCVAGAADFSNVKTLTAVSSQGGRSKKGTTGLKEMFRMPLRRSAPTSSKTLGLSGNDADNLIWITFRQEISVSLIRIYNYNAGRTHIAKGVRHLQIRDQDNRVLFSGEIARATGSSKSPPESILFATEADMHVLATIISQNDAEAERELEALAEQDGALMRSFNMQNSDNFESPATTPQGRRTNPSLDDPEFRSPISTKRAKNSVHKKTASKSVSFAPGALSKLSSSPANPRSSQPRRRGSLSSGGSTTADFPIPAYPEDCPRNVVAAVLTLQTTWGDAHFTGLSGMRFFDGKGQRLFGIRSVTILRPPPLDSTSQDETIAAQLFLREFDSEVSSLIDDDACTACVWRFQPNMQVLVIFDEPRAMAESGLGCVQIANYCIQGSTQVGVKRAQVHLLAAAGVSNNNNSNQSVEQCAEALFGYLSDDETVRREALIKSGGLRIIPLTTEDSPLILRKSPNQLSALKFQSFDVSLSYDSSSQSIKQQVEGAGGMRTSMTTSMTASVTVRAKTEMKRARMFLLEPPLPTDIPAGVAVAVGCVLPLGYVFKLDITLLTVVEAPMFDNDVEGASPYRPSDAVSRAIKNVLKGMLLDADTIQDSAHSDANVGFVNLYDEEGVLIDPELYSTGCSITAVNGIASLPSHSPASTSSANGGGDGGGNVRASIALDRQFRALEGGSSSSSAAARGRVASGSGSLPSSGITRRLHQHLNSQHENLTTFTSSSTISLIFVFDIPTALSAVAYQFAGVNRAGTAPRVPTSLTTSTDPSAPLSATTTITNVNVLADDCIIYQSPDLSDIDCCSERIAGTELCDGNSTLNIADDEHQEIPACVAFTYNTASIQKIAASTGTSSRAERSAVGPGATH